MPKTDSDGNVQERAQSADLVKETNRYAVDDISLAGIGTMQALAETLTAEGVATESYDEVYSSGFEVLPSSDALIGERFFIVQWRFNKSKTFFDDNGDPAEFVSAYVVTFDDDGTIRDKWIVNDGSTGLCAQLRRVTDARVKSRHAQPQAGLMVRHGLRKTEYDTTTAEGKKVRGTTYYLA